MSDGIFLLLDDRIYPINLVIKAISDYENIAKVSVSRYEHKITLCFEELKFDGNLVMSKFCNYIIELSQSYRSSNNEYIDYL